MSILDYTLAAFGLAMIFDSSLNVFGIVEHERAIRSMRKDVAEAGEARGVDASKDGGG